MRSLLVAVSLFGVLAFGSPPERQPGRVTLSGRGHSVTVRSYTTRRGSYVRAHHRTAADGTRSSNWSHVGNVNPYTGKAGTKP